MQNLLRNVDCLQGMKELPDNSIDLIVTDPPYGLFLMGREFDRKVPSIDAWEECLRVLKPGAFAFIMSSPRQDVLCQMLIHLKEAGFKLDFTSVYWAYAQGMPKGMNISKAIDKRAGAERKVVGKYVPPSGKKWNLQQADNPETEHASPTFTSSGTRTLDITEPATELAKKMDGSYAGFNPKPAVETILVAMKPLSEKNYIEQAAKTGKGVTWIDGCRIPINSEDGETRQGRFPANLLVSDDVLNDGTVSRSGQNCVRRKTGKFIDNVFGGENVQQITYPDEGSFSRYFDLDRWWENNNFNEIDCTTLPVMISSKPSPSEKNIGLGEEQNIHISVKPLKLMCWLVELGSRKDDVVMDPFMGSGTTCMAAKMLERQYVGFENEEEYFKIAEARVEATVVGKKNKVKSELPFD